MCLVRSTRNENILFVIKQHAGKDKMQKPEGEKKQPDWRGKSEGSKKKRRGVRDWPLSCTYEFFFEFGPSAAGAPDQMLHPKSESCRMKR